MIGKILTVLLSTILGFASATVYFILANEVFYGTMSSGIPFASMSAVAAVGLALALLLHAGVFILLRKKFKLFSMASLVLGTLTNLTVFLVMVSIKVYF